MVPVTVDMAGALALARASGVPGRIAAPLLMAAAEGVRIGAHERMTEAETP